jgi:hypothetical protein
MYYGNPNSGTQQNPEMVWNSNYVMVHHMNDETPSSIHDSTSFENDGEKGAEDEPSESTGKIEKSQYFDGDDYIDVMTDISLEINSDITAQCWVKTSSYDEVILDKMGTAPYLVIGYRMSSNSKDDTGFGISNSDGTVISAIGGSISDGNWHHLVGTYNQATRTLKWYKDGYIDGINTDAPSSIGINDLPFCIGSTSNHGSDKINGYIDEVRISNINQNQDWILTEYCNQNSPSSFLSFGLEETHICRN